MSSIKTPVWIAPLFGGIALTTMSTASTYYVEKQLPKAKALARDFILGAVLVLCIMQILPESVASSVATLLSFTSIFKGASDAGSINKVVESVSSVTPAIFAPDFTGSSDDTEVRVGVPRF